MIIIFEDLKIMKNIDKLLCLDFFLFVIWLCKKFYIGVVRRNISDIKKVKFWLIIYIVVFFY